MAKFRSWNEETKHFYYFKNGEYSGAEDFSVWGNIYIDFFNWQNAEQIIDPIEADENALGCGLEDQGITDRYDAMMYGFNQAIEAIESELNIHYEK